MSVNGWGGSPELGIPGRSNCAHATPTFGCLCCIAKQKDAWAMARFDEFKKHYRPRKCKSCGGKMRPYDWEIKASGLFANIVCDTYYDGEGHFCHDDEHQVFVCVE